MNLRQYIIEGLIVEIDWDKIPQEKKGTNVGIGSHFLTELKKTEFSSNYIREIKEIEKI